MRRDYPAEHFLLLRIALNLSVCCPKNRNHVPNSAAYMPHSLSIDRMLKINTAVSHTLILLAIECNASGGGLCLRQQPRDRLARLQAAFDPDSLPMLLQSPWRRPSSRVLISPRS
jgi:hypothetical protein